MGMNKEIAEIVTEITDMFPIAQVSTGAAYFKRSKVYGLIWRHVAKVKKERQDEINELSRKLYIAEKKIEDDATDNSGNWK